MRTSELGPTSNNTELDKETHLHSKRQESVLNCVKPRSSMCLNHFPSSVSYSKTLGLVQRPFFAIRNLRGLGYKL